MQNTHTDLTVFEELRESGDYVKLMSLLPGDWQEAPAFVDHNIVVRLLAAEIFGRDGRLDEMESALAPYLGNIGRVPFGLAARLMLVLSMYHNRRSEPQEALRLAEMGRAVATAQGDEYTAVELVQAEGQVLWSLDKWDEAAERFEEAVSLYAAQGRSYRLGLACLGLGGVLGRIGRVEESRTALERAIRILLKSRDDFNLAVARVDVALALNAMGEYEILLKYLQFAHDAFDQMGHQVYTLMSLNKIAEVLIWLKEYDRSETFIGRSLDIAAAIRSTQVAFIYELKGRLYLSRSDYDQAEKAVRASIEMADQAGSRLQRAEAKRTLGRVFLAQHREAEAAPILREALREATDVRSSLLELEIKALLSQAICATAPVEACRLMTEVEAELADRSLPELKRTCQITRKHIDSLDREHFFILSDAKMPTLSEAKIALLKWLWARALYKAKGNAREAAEQLNVTPTYIRKLTKLIPRDLLRPGRKRSKRRKGLESV
jgi:tetratricopeptide (TPR) repeat protein